MKLKFFQPRAKGAAPAQPTVNVHFKGKITANYTAAAAIGAEPGESATLCFDEETQRWLFCHWPNGQDGQPTLRAAAGKTTAVVFQATTVAEGVFSAAGTPAVKSITFLLDAETPLTDEQAAGATLYLLQAQPINPATAATHTTTAAAAKPPRQLGVGRGNYDRSTANRKGGNRG